MCLSYFNFSDGNSILALSSIFLVIDVESIIDQYEDEYNTNLDQYSDNEIPYTAEECKTLMKRLGFATIFVSGVLICVEIAFSIVSFVLITNS